MAARFIQKVLHTPPLSASALQEVGTRTLAMLGIGRLQTLLQNTPTDSCEWAENVNALNLRSSQISVQTFQFVVRATYPPAPGVAAA